VVEDLALVLNHNKPAAQRKNLKQVSDNQWRLQKAESD